MGELLKYVGITRPGIWKRTLIIAKLLVIMAVIQTASEIIVFQSARALAQSGISVEEFKNIYSLHIIALIVIYTIILLLNIYKDYQIYRLDEYRELKIISKMAVLLFLLDFSAYAISQFGYLNFLNEISNTTGNNIEEFLANLTVRVSKVNTQVEAMIFLLSMVNIITLLSILYYLGKGLDARGLRISIIFMFFLFILSPAGFLGSIARMLFYFILAYAFKEVGDRVRNISELEKQPVKLLHEINDRLVEGRVYLKTLALDLNLPFNIIYYLVEKWIKKNKINAVLDGTVLEPI